MKKVTTYDATTRDIDKTLSDNNAPLRQPVQALIRVGNLCLGRYGALIVFFGLWQMASSLGWLNAAVIPPLDRIVVALYNALLHGTFLGDIGISLQRSGTAFGASVLVAIPLGLVMGSFRAIEQTLDPILQLFRQTSALAVYPVFILLMGLGEASKVFVIFWASVFPLLMNTIAGVQQADPKLIEMVRVFGASRLEVFRRVVVPSAIPSIFVGLRLSATSTLLLLVAAEMIGANQGIGFQVMNAQYNFQTPLMFAAIFLLAGLGLLANYLLVVLQKHLCRWENDGNA